MTGKLYSTVIAQIKYLTGKYIITCPLCSKPATARVRRPQIVNHRLTRYVQTTCHHCRGSVDFLW